MLMNTLNVLGSMWLTGCGRSVIERLEQRCLLSSGVDVGNDTQVGTLSVETIEWDGRPTQVVANQWIVLLEHNEPSIDEEGNFDSGVKFVSDEHNRAEGQAMLDQLGLGLRFDRNLGVDHMFTVSVSDGVTYQQLEASLKQLPGFKSVEPVQIGSWAAVPNDTDFSLQWGLSQPSDRDIDAVEAWDVTTGWSGAAVAVIDSGVDLQHTDIDGNIWVNPGETPGDGIDNDGNGRIDDVNGWDFYGNGSTPDNNPDDVFGHGTNVAGVIAAEGNNGQGIAGVSWRNKVMALRIGDWEPVSSHVIAAIEYVNRLRQKPLNINVRVINLSLTIGASAALSNAIDRARELGIVVVAAAGNSGVNIESSPVYPASYAHDNIISVAASDQSDQKPTFSNYGVNSVDLAAPGVSIRTLLNGGGTTSVSGTSFAAPMVAGVAALLFAVKPDVTYTQVVNAILNNVDSVSALSGLVKTGGRLNAANAVAAIGTGAAKTFIGDATTAPRADDVLLRPKPGASTTTQIMLYQTGVGYQVFAELANSSSKRIDVYGLGSGDFLNVDAGVLNKIYAGGSEGNDNFNTDDATSSVTLNGEAGNDTLIGGSNNDDLEGSSGHDRLEGRGGNDSLFGVNQNDTIFGGAGNDRLIGGDGNDSLFGEDGADLIQAIDGLVDTGSGGAGTDTLEVDAIDQITQ